MNEALGRQATQLLEAYLASLESRTPVSPEDYIARCPARDRDALRLAIEGALFLRANYAPSLVNEDMLHRAQERISHIIRARSAAAAATPTPSPTVPLQGTRTILSRLSALLGISPPQDAPPLSLLAPAMFARGSSPTASSSALPLTARAYDKRAAANANHLLHEFEDPPPPIDPRTLAEAIGILVIEEPTEDGDGCVLIDGDIAGILVNASVRNEGRKRFTVAHELGHVRLHSHQVTYRVESLADIESQSTDRMEREANAFATELLMPEYSVRQYAHNHPSFELIEQLAELHATSLTAAAIRAVSISDFACALVSIRAGAVAWVVRSAHWSNYFIPVGLHPSRETQAYDVIHGLPTEDHFESTDAVLWAPDYRGPRDAELLEHSRRLTSDTILTLLRDPRTP